MLVSTITVYGGGSGAISAGHSSSFVIQSDGSLWAWGDNSAGQLGDGTTVNRYAPVKIIDDVVAVSSGVSHTMAIRNDGSLWGWGSNNRGELGDGTTERQFAPIRIMDDVVHVSTGYYTTMAIRTDGSLWAWGIIRIEGDSQSYMPVKIMDDIIAVSTSGTNTAVIKSDGSLWAWGANLGGRLGDGTNTSRPTPYKIKDEVVVVSAGDSITMAVRADDSLWTRGNNAFGNLGDGTIINRQEPVKILDEVVFVSTGTYHSTAIRTDGSLWLWGANHGLSFVGWDYGVPFHHMPAWVMDDVIDVSVGGHIHMWGPMVSHTMVLRTDGSLWTWGENHVGQLGDGTTTARYEPVKIMDNVMLPGGIEPVEPLPPPPPLPQVSSPFEDLLDVVELNTTSTSTLRFTIGSNNFLHNETLQQLEVSPFISQGRTMVPLRIIAESLGAEVDWNSTTRTVIISGREETINLIVDVSLPGDMGTPIIVNGFTFVPVRYVSEKLGATVRWDGENNAVYIYGA